MTMYKHTSTFKNIAIFGSSGAIGKALTSKLANNMPHSTIYTFSRNNTQTTAQNIIHTVVDYQLESSISNAAEIASSNYPLDLVIVATGILHDSEVTPEKSLKDLSYKKFMHLFSVNTVLPAIIAKHLIPKLNRKNTSVFAALSARIGSISDNRLGGWYSYRASKAALNMIIKNAAIETARTNKNGVIIGLHPGTVDSFLSKPFQGNIPTAKLFSPDYSAEKLLNVLTALTPESSGKCFAWDGKTITP